MRVNCYVWYAPLIILLLSCNKKDNEIISGSISTLLVDSELGKKIDFLINVDSIRQAREVYLNENNTLADVENNYLVYKLNKNIFFHNYFNPCDSLSFIQYAKTIKIFQLLNEYYVDYKFHDESNFKNIINEYLHIHNDDFILKGELYSEIGRFYLNEGNNPDSSDFYYNKAVNLFHLNSIVTIQHYLNLRSLVYLQFPLRKELKALAYIENLGKLNAYFPKDLNKQLIFHSLKAFALARLDRHDESDIEFKLAFNTANFSPCTYYEQELYKLYFSAKSNLKSGEVDTKKLTKLEEICQKYGDFCNLNKIKGEYFLLKEEKTIKAEKHLENAFQYIIQSRPYNTLQVYTVMYELYQCYVKNNKFELALDIIYSQENQLIPTKIYRFELDKVLSPNFSKKKFHFITLESLSDVLFRKYIQYNRISDLMIATSLINYADTMIVKAMQTYDDNVIHSVHNSSNSVYTTGAKIYYSLYKYFKKDEYLFKYIYLVEKNRDRILVRDLNLRKSKNSLLLVQENSLKQKLSHFKSKGYTDSVFYYINALEVFYQKNSNSKLNGYDSNQKVLELSTWKNKINEKTIITDINKMGDDFYIFYTSNIKSGIDVVKGDSLLINNVEKVKNIQSQYDKSNKAIDYNKSATLVYNHLLKEVVNEYDTIIYTDTPVFSGLNPEGLTADFLDTDTTFQSLKYLVYTFHFEKVPSIYVYFQNKNKIFKHDNITSFLHTDNQTILNSYLLQKELPGNISENKILTEITQKHTCFSGQNCIKRNFTSASFQNTDILHLSLHGYSNNNNMQDLYLLFRNTKRPDTLKGYEILSIPSSPPLIILTACESGKGKYAEGEGNYTLGRYFLRTGSSKIIQSLWNLDDSAGSLLVKYFYQDLKKHQSPSVALRFAKINILQKYANFCHPYFWAGLV